MNFQVPFQITLNTKQNKKQYYSRDDTITKQKSLLLNTSKKLTNKVKPETLCTKRSNTIRKQLPCHKHRTLNASCISSTLRALSTSKFPTNACRFRAITLAARQVRGGRAEVSSKGVEGRSRDIILGACYEARPSEEISDVPPRSRGSEAFPNRKSERGERAAASFAVYY